MEPPKFKGDNCWLPEHERWLEILPKSQHPNFAFIPKDFEGPSLAKDGINLLAFDKDKKAFVLDGRNYRSTTPDQGRVKGWPRRENEEDVVKASIFGKNDHFTNAIDLTDKCHLLPYALETAEGYRVGHCRGHPPGTFCPCSRVNNLMAIPLWNKEDSLHYWLLVPIISPLNIRIPDGIFELVDYNLKVTPDKRVNILDYYPNLVAPRGYYFLAIPLSRGSDFHLIRPDEEEISAGTRKPRENGLVIVSHLDIELAIHYSAMKIRHWDNIERSGGHWPKQKPFNQMINAIIDTIRSKTDLWLQPGVGETPEFWNASIQGKKPQPKVSRVTGLVKIHTPRIQASVNTIAAPLNRRPTRNTNSTQIVDGLFDPDHPDRRDPQIAKSMSRSMSRKRFRDKFEAERIQCRDAYTSDSEVDEDGPADVRKDDTVNLSNDEAGALALSTRHPTTPLPSETEEDEVEAIVVLPRRTARSRTKKNVQPHLSNNSAEDEEAPPLRRSSRAASRKKSVATSNADSEDEQVVVQARGRPRTRATRNTRPRRAVAPRRDKTAGEPVRKGPRTRAATKTAPVTDNEPEREDEAPKVARTRSRRAASSNTATENAQAGPGPATVAMRGKKRSNSSPETQNSEHPKQKKTRGRG
ncbi:hypothetical protein CYLTODRAFT_453343 [Cylindrobasidium torrendii FP15055 ss-10]|uniref:Uncharacterized protein n=1 Tax=Cylindrobasidium torrendii FP15055 ss-10 TaxID=1314674 RepID=A0A0D7BET8_9AGAR|nr:hypothetical protein CYLTODRAFT_453343 [Cylindrobasidium torrendii FP15055 ss-10]